MADKPWKRHERDTGEYFGTTRALHGLSRTHGEVKTDVFVDVHDWFIAQSQRVPPEESVSPTAIIAECKFCDKSSGATNDWPCKMLAEIAKEPGVKSCDAIPVLKTRDGWTWIQMTHFLDWYKQFHLGLSIHPYDKYEVRHLNRKVSKFFGSAIDQAEAAVLPPRGPGRKTYYRRIHLVCVGTNARVPKVIGLPPNYMRGMNADSSR